MLKRFDRFAGVVLAAAFALTSCIPSLAYTGSGVIGNLSASEQVLYSVRGQNAPAALLEELDDLAVHVDGNTLLEVVPMQTSTNAAASTLNAGADAPTVLMVTNENGSTVTKDVIVAISPDGNFVSIQPENPDVVSPLAGGGAYLPDDANNLVRATAVYNKVYPQDDTAKVFAYYQPVSMYFIYYSNGVNTMASATVSYQTDGFEYTYPGFADVSNGNTHLHTISRQVSNPISNMIYHEVNEYRTDRALWISGAPWAGHYFEFSFIVDGRELEGVSFFYENN